MLRRREVPQPRRRSNTSAGALVAAARRLDEPSGTESERRARKAEDWQQRAFEYMAQIPEVEYSARYFGDAFARMRLYVGIRTDANGDPTPLKDEPEDEVDYTPAEVELCEQALRALTSPEGGQSEIQRRFGVQLAMPGEAYLVGRPVSPQSDETRWDVYSLRELRVEQTNRKDDDGRLVNNYYLMRRGQSTGGTQLPPETVVSRIWRPDAEYSQEAVSPMRAAEAILEELLTLTKSIQAGALSRVAGPGMMGMPNSMRPPALDPNEDETNGQAVATDNVVADLLTVASAALDPASAAARVPLMIWMDDELWKDWGQDKLVTWGRDIDNIAAEQRAELIKRFAAVIDIPAEVLTGMGDVKYWNLEYIGAEGFRAHIEPAVVIMDDGLTRNYLRPALEAYGVERPERFWIWHDPGSLVADPDRADTAQMAHEAYAISDARYRDDLGYTDDDAPDPEELFRRLTIASAAAGRPPVLTDPGALEEDAVIDVPPALAAAATEDDDDFDPLLDRYAEMDTGLLLWTQQLADGAMRRALERANAKIVRAAQRDKAALDVLGNVPSLLIAGTLGPAWVARLTDSGDLFGDVFIVIRDQYVRRITRVGDEALLLAQKYASAGTLDDLRVEMYRMEFAADADASWEMLHAALIEEANRLLFNPAPEAEPGEVDGALVSAGVVRGALARAGGTVGLESLVAARPMSARRKSETIGPRPTSMLTSDRYHRLLDEAGVVVTKWEWRYGDPSLRLSTFEPHRKLSGKSFHFWDDEVLVNRTGWPKVDHFWPMDHKGCLCMVVRARAKRKARR